MGHCEFVQGSNMDINSAAVPPDVVASCRCKKQSMLPFWPIFNPIFGMAAQATFEWHMASQGFLMDLKPPLVTQNIIFTLEKKVC